MKKNSILMLAVFLVLGFGYKCVFAQFPIKIPKLPKTEKPKPEPPKSDNNSPANQPSPNDSTQVQSKQNTAVQNNSVPAAQTNKFMRPAPPGTPLLLINTLEISIAAEDKYWKFPNQRYYSNWIPKVSFKNFYDNNERSRYTAEWYKPDGSPWFSESLEAREITDGTLLKSPYNAKLFENVSTDQIGTYALKITNNKTGEVVFQGKFNVKKSIDTPGDPQMKNAFQFFVDNDWHLAVGYAGINQGTGTLELDPEVLLWFKGAPERRDLEARLFFNNQEIASTDDGGLIVDDQTRGDECVRGQEICRYVLYSFSWDKFKFYSQSYMRSKYPNAVFTDDQPGEYTVKVFHKGAQVREAKFTVAPDGKIARNGFSGNVYPMLTLIPVKVSGTAEKWNPNSWKTGMFYGNPPGGFSVP